MSASDHQLPRRLLARGSYGSYRVMTLSYWQ
jgi:hypothetical protein